MISRNPAPFLAFLTRYNTTIVDCMVSWFPTHTLTITHNFRALREQPKGQVGENKKGAADNTL